MQRQHLELHVWGRDGNVSILDPESRACAWLLFLHLSPTETPFSVVTSCNTNLTDTRKLPVLVVNERGSKTTHEGFYSIVEYVSTLYPSESKFIPTNRLTASELLVNLALVKYIQNTFHFIHQYNLYVNTRNYELFTRKQFSKLLPFPMYYNQPLKLHQSACEQVKTVGLGASSAGFFGLSGAVPETETVKDDEDDYDKSNTVAISALHEKAMLAKDKDRALLRESRMGLRCLNLLDEYVNHLIALFKELNPESPVEFAHLFRPTKISASELLLYSHIYSMAHSDLPDRFIYKYLGDKFPSFMLFYATITEALNGCMASDKFRAPVGDEVPSLWNEVKLWVPSFSSRKEE